MFNHVTNKITIVSSTSNSNEHIINSCLDEKGYFDFNKIVPIDEEFKNFEPHDGIITSAKNAMGIAADSSSPLLFSLEKSNRERACFSPVDKKDIDDIIKAIKLFKKTGYFYWYEAQRAAWGTKWNAYNGYLSENVITFETAWNHPRPIYIALSEKFPDATFKIEYADEDLGHNCGIFFIKNGEIFNEECASSLSERNEEDRKKWMKFAVELKYPGTPLCDLGMNENYEYIDD